ncbi:MAG: hypothetical protein M3174_03855 [Actinomycetota bacterium]|nr:hypothetical protein [Actinomycetota bacterium]
MQQKATVLVVDADLLGLARIEGAAARAERAVKVADASGLKDELPDVDLVIIDLDRGREASLDALDAARSSGRLTARVILFVSHVDEALAQRARERGYETFARGRFWRSLDDLLNA